MYNTYHPGDGPFSPSSDEAFLRAYDVAAYDRPSVRVDVVVLTVVDRRLGAVLGQRVNPPQKGLWALPGSFVRMDESLDDAVRRVLRRKVGLEEVFLEQLYTFGRPNRDPRTRVISIAYYALVNAERLTPALQSIEQAMPVRVNVPWPGEVGGPVDCYSPEGEPLEMAFDHADILGLAIQRIRAKVDYAPIGFQLLPQRFTLRDLQTVHETILGDTTNKDSFRRRMLSNRSLEATGDRQSDVGHRPAELYRFVKRSAV